MIVTGQPRCTLISCVRDPTEATINGSWLNYDYYIQKQIGPALNRVFMLLNQNVLEWYRNMPRSTRPTTNFGDKKL